MITIKIKDFIKTDLAVSVEDGDIIYEEIVKGIEKEEEVILDFYELDLITTAFLNNALGKLYSKYSGDELNKYVKIRNIKKGDLTLLQDVRNRATHSLGENFKKALLEELGDD